MNSTEKKRAFIIRFLYAGLWVGLIYCILKYALPLFMPFVLGFIISFMLKPLINLVSKKCKFSRKLSAILVLTLAYLVVGGLLTFIIIKLVVVATVWFGRLPAFYSHTIEPALHEIGNWFDGLISGLDPSLLSFFETASESITSGLSRLVGNISSGALSILTGVATRVPWFIVGLFLTILSSYFFVVDYYRITSWITKQMGKDAQRKLFVIKDYVVNVIFRFGRAYLIIMTITFIEVSVGLLILRVKGAFWFGALIAVVDILPVLGSGTILIPWAIYNLIVGEFFRGFGLLVLYAIIAVIRQLIEPRIVGKQIGLYPLLTLVCMFIGARMFGFWGMFGLPIALTVILHLNEVGEISIFK